MHFDVVSELLAIATREGQTADLTVIGRLVLSQNQLAVSATALVSDMRF